MLCVVKRAKELELLEQAVAEEAHLVQIDLVTLPYNVEIGADIASDDL